MDIVTRHDIPDLDVLRTDLASIEEEAGRLLERVRVQEPPESVGGRSALGQLWRTYTDGVADLSVLEPDGTRIRELTALARQAGVGVFWASEGPVTWPPVEVQLGPWTFEVPATGRSMETTPDTWETVMWQQEVCRSGRAQKMLLPDEEFTVAPGTDAYVLAWVEALRAFSSSSPHTQDAILRALELTTHENAPATDPDLLDLIVFPKAWALHLALQGPTRQDDFTKALLNGLKHHRRYWGTPERARRREGFVSWPLLGVTAVALAYGFEIEVSSEYLPERLLHPEDWAESLPW